MDVSKLGDSFRVHFSKKTSKQFAHLTAFYGILGNSDLVRGCITKAQTKGIPFEQVVKEEIKALAGAFEDSLVNDETKK